MDEHMHISMVFTCIVTVSFLLSQFSHCQQPLPHGYNYSVCKEESYNCGELSNISYPFWGQNRPSYCGGGDLFKLSCNDQNGPNTTTALIDSQNFTVLEINPADYTFRIVRTDLVHDVCSPQFNDIYLSPTLFKASVYNITISYNCSSVDFPFSGNNYFTCGDENVIYRVDSEEITSNLPACGRHVQVLADAPLNASGGVDALKAVLEKGFEVNYVVAPECVSCLGSEGICSTIDFQKNVSSCYYCPDGSHALHCSALINIDHKSTRFSWERKAIIGVSAAVAGSILMCIVFCCRGCKSSTWREKFCLTTNNELDVEAFLKNHGALAQKRYKFSEVKKMTNSFKVQLGQGGFGVVYKGKLLGTGCPIAVKLLNASKGNGEDFINEVASITSHTSEIYFPHWVYNRLELGSDLRPNQVMAKEENDIAKRMTIVGLWCIQTLPNDRPTISKVIDMLEGSMDSLEMPPKPLHSSPTRSEPESST
ncbi:Wall-associated receptor kinase, C-terminal [Sesbania bispinosa]|nr:Wall-associated receptor kinase, C-terminal [Sesbania bispinosa]